MWLHNYQDLDQRWDQDLTIAKTKTAVFEWHQNAILVLFGGQATPGPAGKLTALPQNP